MDSKEILFRDRETGEVRKELIFGEGGLRFFYENPLGKLLTSLFFRREWFSRLAGRVQRGKGSRKRIPGYIEKLGIDASEAELPVESYGTLDDFFTRRLRPGARPVEAAPDRLVAPCDGRVLVFPSLPDVVEVKGCRTPVADLLGGEEAARPWREGVLFIHRLSPADYHRFHFPDGGQAGPSTRIGRGLHSVHPVALASGVPVFRNKRTTSILESDGFGRLSLIEVGAMIVGTIEQTYSPGRVERGDEKGMFRFGGSTVMLLSEKGRVAPDEDLVEASAQGMETLVKYGTGIGKKA